jgi:large subunit ribosomal protein L5
MACMHSNDFYYDHIFTRDMLLKMQYKTVSNIVRLDKVTIDHTSQYVLTDKKNILPAFVALQLFAGQTPQLTCARQSIASFKLRQGAIVGCYVTLRKSAMHTFLRLFLEQTLPRIKRLGLYSLTDSQPHVHIGLNQTLFLTPLEKNVELFEFMAGCNVHIHTRATRFIEKRLISTAFGIPTI